MLSMDMPLQKRNTYYVRNRLIPFIDLVPRQINYQQFPKLGWQEDDPDLKGGFLAVRIVALITCILRYHFYPEEYNISKHIYQYITYLSLSLSFYCLAFWVPLQWLLCGSDWEKNRKQVLVRNIMIILFLLPSE